MDECLDKMAKPDTLKASTLRHQYGDGQPDYRQFVDMTKRTETEMKGTWFISPETSREIIIEKLVDRQVEVSADNVRRYRETLQSMDDEKLKCEHEMIFGKGK